MISGYKVVERTPEEVRDRLVIAMAAGNFRIVSEETETGPANLIETMIRFQHGTYLSETSTFFPKSGAVWFYRDGDKTVVAYAVSLDLFPRIWLTLIGVMGCWLIFAGDWSVSRNQSSPQTVDG